MTLSEPFDRKEWQRQRFQALRHEWLRSAGPCRDCGTHRKIVMHWTGPHPRPKSILTRSAMWRQKFLPLCIPLCFACSRKRTRMEKEMWTHGTITCYKGHGCRCPACTEVNAAYERGRRSRSTAPVTPLSQERTSATRTYPVLDNHLAACAPLVQGDDQ